MHLSIPRFSKQEKLIFAGCFFAYLFTYTARLNLSAALPNLSQSLHLTSTQAGLIQTVFAIVYASGQFVNGAIVDRVSPRLHIVCGLVLSALCNLLFGLSSHFWQLVLLWGLNGAAQSMLWTPIVRLIAVWFDDQKRSFVSFCMCLCFVIGHFAAWLISGLMSALFAWRYSFIVPAGILLLTAVMAALCLRDRQHTVVYSDGPAMSLRQLLFGTGLWLIFIGNFATGFARDGVTTWAPTMIGQSLGEGNALSGTLVSLLIPVINTAGLFFGQMLLNRSQGNIRATVCKILAGAIVCMLVLAVLSAPPALVLALLMGTLCALMHSVSNMQSVMLPMDFAYTGRVALVAGLCDCMLYLGSSLVSVTSGALIESSGPSAMYLSWALAAVISGAAILLSGRKKRA